MKKQSYLLLLLVILLGTSSGAPAQVKERLLVGPNIRVSRDHDTTFTEMSAAVHPAEPKKVVVTAMFNQPSKNRPGSQGFYSDDGGYTWRQILFPEADGDPISDYGVTGTAYFLVIGNTRDGKDALLFYRSKDGGNTWDAPIPLQAADRPVLVVDRKSNRKGNLYIKGIFSESDGAEPDSYLGLLRSTDDGQSWSKPVEVATTRGRGVGVNNTFVGVFSSGEVFVPFFEFLLDPEAIRAAEQSGRQIKQHYFSISRDGGATFSDRQKLQAKDGSDIKIGLSTPFYTIDESEGRFKDRIYVVWDDPRFDVRNPDLHTRSRLLISYSSDLGKSWSKPNVVDMKAPGKSNQFRPSIAVNKDGTVAVSWYDTRDTPDGEAKTSINRYMSVSFDGGESFLTAVRVSTEPSSAVRKVFNTLVQRSTFVLLRDGARDIGGDYLPITSDANGDFHVFWADDRTGSYQVWTARVKVDRQGKSGTTTKDLIETDISSQVEVMLDAMLRLTPADVTELPIRLRNKSGRSIYGPIKIEVESYTSPYDTPSDILNSNNGKTGVGAAFDYTKAISGFGSLAPGAVSEAVTWRFKTKPNQSPYTVVKLKVTARVEKTN